MGLLKKRTNKKFGYTPRYYQNDGEGSPYQIEHKFDKFRHTVGDNKGMKGNFKQAWEDMRRRPDRTSNRRIIIIAVIFLLLFLFIIEFDFSIFSYEM